MRSALQEVAAISKGTSCRQFLFSLSLNPPGAEDVSVATFFDAIARGWVRPQVHHRFPLADAGQAHRALEGRSTTGSVVLVV